jgi:ectoine hydroxylase-related dioxygenase (phytanoyl-CoA dioxygenase family)
MSNLNENGYIIFRNVLGNDWISKLRDAATNSFKIHRDIQLSNKNDILTDGVALHVILNNDLFIQLLDYFITSELFKYIREDYFKSNFILNSFTALNNIPNQLNFSGVVHRDIRFFSGNTNLMLNMLILIDDFTEDNGPTLILPKSHTMEVKPSDEYFHKNCIKVLGKSGDILIFNSNLWHCSSENRTDQDRIALPITLTKSSIKQLLDYPRAFGYDRMSSFNEDLKQLLGYFSRVPANLEEWYQPYENRFYKKNQD